MSKDKENEEDNVAMDQEVYVDDEAAVMLTFEEEEGEEDQSSVEIKTEIDTLGVISDEQLISMAVNNPENVHRFAAKRHYGDRREVLENRKLIKQIQQQQKDVLKKQQRMQSTLDAILIAINSTAPTTSPVVTISNNYRRINNPTASTPSESEATTSNSNDQGMNSPAATSSESAATTNNPNCQRIESAATTNNPNCQRIHHPPAPTSTEFVATYSNPNCLGISPESITNSTNFRELIQSSAATSPIPGAPPNSCRGMVHWAIDLAPVVVNADTDGFIELGGKDITPPLLFSSDVYKRLLRSNRKPTLLTKALMGELFTRAEMAISNMGGKKGKKALDTRKITAICMQIDIQFSSAGIQLDAKEIKNAINDKCRYMRFTLTH